MTNSFKTVETKITSLNQFQKVAISKKESKEVKGGVIGTDDWIDD